MSEARACPNCGYLAQSKEAKCPSCGAALSATAAATAPPAPATAEPAEAAESIPQEQQVNPTVCSGCGASSGSPWPMVGGLPWCPACREGLYQRPFPMWLKASLAGLLALLVYSYVHGAQYFEAGRALVSGERLVEQRKFAEAVPLLQSVIQTAPNCEKCVLLMAKAQLLSGDPAGAYQNVMKHNGGQFETSALFNEVQGIFTRMDQAAEKMKEAQKLSEEDRDAEAEAAIHAAATIFPEYPHIQESLATVRAGAAFVRKDYDGFLRLAEEAWQRDSNSFLYAGQMASALACKYASTGDGSYKARAEEFLARANQMAASDEEKKLQAEYEERIRHRLRTREIISKKEYDQRYRPAAQEKKP